jgi:SAM-dependent methyltransferase
MSADVFDRYASYYDLLYQDKDYEAETDYVARTLREADPNIRTLLEFGSGTGQHGRLLAGRGFEVFGVERSKRMVAAAKAAQVDAGAVDFDCQQADIGVINLGRTFDAVIALFHVMSYQTSDDAIGRAFSTAAQHLKPGGLFLFDVWHGPAVLKQPPEVRTKQVSDETTKLTRTAMPELRSQEHVVVVRYNLVAEPIGNGSKESFQEEHAMRYFFPSEIESLARRHGFKIEHSEEFMTGREPSEATWAVCYLLRKNL